MDRNELFEKIDNNRYSGTPYEQSRSFKNDLKSYLFKEYPEFKDNEKIAYGIINHAWKQSHSYSYNEVMGAAEELADLVSDILKVYNS